MTACAVVLLTLLFHSVGLDVGASHTPCIIPTSHSAAEGSESSTITSGGSSSSLLLLLVTITADEEAA